MRYRKTTPVGHRQRRMDDDVIATPQQARELNGDTTLTPTQPAHTPPPAGGPALPLSTPDVVAAPTPYSNSGGSPAVWANNLFTIFQRPLMRDSDR